MDTSVFRGCMPALMTPCDADGTPANDVLVRKGREPGARRRGAAAPLPGLVAGVAGKADGAAAGGGVGAAAGTAGGPGR